MDFRITTAIGICLGLIIMGSCNSKSEYNALLDFHLGMSPDKYQEISQQLISDGTLESIAWERDTITTYWFSFSDGTGMKMQLSPKINSKELEALYLHHFCYASQCDVASDELVKLKTLYDAKYGDAVPFLVEGDYSVVWNTDKVKITLSAENKFLKKIKDLPPLPEGYSFVDENEDVLQYVSVKYEFSDEEKNERTQRNMTKPSDI